jgi:thiol-disulfide isomerase/thioredoxin
MTDPHAEKPDRTWLYVGLAFVVFWGLYLAVFAPKVAREDLPRFDPKGNFGQAEYDWRLLDLDGKEVGFSQFKGKSIFLNIWATWCGPCVGEMPSIARLAAEPRLKDVAFVCVSTDDDAKTVTRFLAGKGWPMTVLRATDIPPVFATDAIPATFLITPDGRVAAAEVGASDWDKPEVVAFLESLSKTVK